MRGKDTDPDRLELRGKKGIWRRFVLLMFRCRIPWVMLAIYLVMDIGRVNLGVNETDYTARLFAGDTSAALVTKLITVIVINLLAGNLFNFVEWMTRERLDQNMRDALIKKIMRLPMSFFKRENPREAIYRIVDNADVLSLSLILFVLPIFTSAYTSFVVFKRVFTYDWRLSVILLAFIPIRMLHTFIFGRVHYSMTQRGNAVQATLTSRLAEMITNIPLAKAFGKEEREAEKGTKLTERLYRINIKSSWLGQLEDLSRSAVSMVRAAVMTLVAVSLLRDGTITTRAWVAFFMFSSVFSDAVRSLLLYWNNVKVLQGRAERIAEIMDAPEEDLSGEPCDGLCGSLELHDVRFAYEKDQHVLDGISCVFPDNCVTALLGVSGCGKTTVANLLMRLYTPEGGEITVGGKPIGDYALQDYRRQFVMVSQDGMLFSGTIRQNVCYGNGKVTEEELTRALKQARAYDFVMAMPQGLETRIEEYGKNLSGGQRQRLTMARALLSKARYFILDEPTAAMDAIAAGELLDVLRENARERCVIIIAHTPAVLNLAQRVVVVENGTVSGQGTVAEASRTSQFLRSFCEAEVMG